MELIHYSNVDWKTNYPLDSQWLPAHSLKELTIIEGKALPHKLQLVDKLMAAFPGEFAVSGPAISQVLSDQKSLPDIVDIYLLKTQNHDTAIPRALEWLTDLLRKEYAVMEMFDQFSRMENDFAQNKFRIPKNLNGRTMWEFAIEEKILTQDEDGCIVPHPEAINNGVTAVRLCLPKTAATVSRNNDTISVTVNAISCRFHPAAYTLDELAHANGNIGSISAIWTGGTDILLSPDAYYAYTRGFNQVKLENVCPDYVQKLVDEPTKGFGIQFMIDPGCIPEPSAEGHIFLELKELKFVLKKFNKGLILCAVDHQISKNEMVFESIEFSIEKPISLVEILAPPSDKKSVIETEQRKIMRRIIDSDTLPSDHDMLGLCREDFEKFDSIDNVQDEDVNRFLKICCEHFAQKLEKKLQSRDWSKITIKTDHLDTPMPREEFYGDYA